MITKFKIFESSEYTILFDVGDYVFIDFDETDRLRELEGIVCNSRERYLDNRGIILTLDNVDKTYCIVFMNDMVSWFSEKEIIRKLTLEEIEQYKVEMEAKKYNL